MWKAAGRRVIDSEQPLFGGERGPENSLDIFSVSEFNFFPAYIIIIIITKRLQYSVCMFCQHCIYTVIIVDLLFIYLG